MESKEARVARLAQALRENLKKRKDQARDRDSAESPQQKDVDKASKDA